MKMKKKWIKKIWKIIFNRYVLKNKEMEDKAKAIYEINPNWLKLKRFVESDTRSKVGTNEIIELLNKDYNELEEIVEKIKEMIRDKIEKPEKPRNEVLLKEKIDDYDEGRKKE